MLAAVIHSGFKKQSPRFHFFQKQAGTLLIFQQKQGPPGVFQSKNRARAGPVFGPSVEHWLTWRPNKLLQERTSFRQNFRQKPQNFRRLRRRFYWFYCFFAIFMIIVDTRLPQPKNLAGRRPTLRERHWAREVLPRTEN